MRAALALALLAVALAMQTAHAAPARIEGTRDVVVAASIEAPCLAINFNNVAVVSLPLDALERRITAAPTEHWKNETERLALIAAKRATSLWQLADAAPDTGRCRQVAGEQIPLDSQYLVAQLLDEGEVAVSDLAGNSLQAILATVDNPHCQRGPHGTLLYALPHPRRIFLALTACVV